jgi:hypothetical protein
MITKTIVYILEKISVLKCLVLTRLTHPKEKYTTNKSHCCQEKSRRRRRTEITFVQIFDRSIVDCLRYIAFVALVNIVSSQQLDLLQTDLVRTYNRLRCFSISIHLLIHDVLDDCP